ncbi:MAG: CopG family transcriptional regulator [Dehalococcoidia bacterium]|nr:CopG family transcriptional regulator [Dehalococcoidia bacterium]
MAVRVNFTLPQDLVEALKLQVGEHGRSAFVAQALRLRLAQLERARIDALLEEGYKASFAEDQELARELDGVSADGLDNDD